MSRRALALLAALAALAPPAAALGPPAAASAAECPRTSLAEVEADVMCPVCGTPLALASEAPQAIRQRALIQRLVDRCRSKREIEDVLVAQFGDNVLALPQGGGFKLSVYLVPALAALLAAGGVGIAARRWRRAGGARADGGEPDERATERLETDLRRYEL